MDSNETGYSSEQDSESQSIDISRKIELVKKIALYLKARIPDYFEAEDLIQIGMIGLIEASRNFDPSIGVSFDEYAKRRIKGAILDEVRKASSLSRLAVKNNREYSSAKNSLTNSLGRQPTNEFNLVQLDNDLIEADGAFEDQQSNPMLSIEQAELSDRLTNEISKLDERSKLIISLYYVEELNMKEIGAVIGVNESRVSQLLSATALKLRGSLI
jgi:RNA polymerase sigma factor for flagellar operon FliA